MTAEALGLVPLQNGRALISRIPDDILYEIFVLLAWEGWEDDSPVNKPSLTGQNKWLAVCHVCAHWRHLALASPRLWSVITIDRSCDPRMLHAFLERSQDHPLRVSFQGPIPDEDTVTHSIFASMARLLNNSAHRLVELSILDFKEAVTSLIAVQFVNPAPELRSFNIIVEPQNSPSPYDLPRTMFADNTPLLKTIMLVNADYPHRPFSNLTNMCVMCGVVPSLEYMISALRLSPTLEMLAVGLKHPTSPPQFASGIDNIATLDLPRLRKLVLHAPHDVGAALLSRLSFPTTVSTLLHLIGRPQSPDQRTRNPPALQALASTIRSLELQVFRLRGSWVAQTDSTSSIFSIHWVGIDYDGEEDEDIINSRLDHFGFITTFPNTQHLSIKSVSYQLYPSDWRHILRTMPCAISMELHDTASLALAEALRPARVAEDSHDELGHSGIVCPLLQSFTVLTALRAYVLDILVGAFEARKARGLVLKTLTVMLDTGMMYTPRLLQRLQGVAQDVLIHYGVRTDNA